MSIPLAYLAKIGIPLIISALFLERNAPEQYAQYSEMLRFSDEKLSIANGDGGGMDPEIFDYIIIGGGSAGSVVANRLTKSGEFSVLLLEAGGSPNPISDIPLAQEAILNSDMVIQYKSVPSDVYCVIRENKTCGFQRGKALGGSSSVNGLLYNRCNRNDYNAWAEWTNDDVWSFENVVEAYKRLENYHGFYEETAGSNHGTDGELFVGTIDYLPGVIEFNAALTEKGIPIGDLNSGEMSFGFSKIDYNIKDGLRWGAYQAFLEPILNRSNLHIYRYATAVKINLDSNNKAVGVTYVRHGIEHYVEAKNEIIVSAGAIDAPKLLLLSGIGPSQDLDPLGIEVMVDSPAVGNYFQDHISVPAPPFTLNKTLGILFPNQAEHLLQYVENGTGPLNSFPWYGLYAPQISNGYIVSKQYNDLSWPDIHVYIHENLRQINQTLEETMHFELELARSTTIGTIKLASSNPENFPLIDPNFYSDPNDVDRLIDGMEFMIDVFLNSTTYQGLGIKWSDYIELTPTCSHLPFPSREYWKCYLPLYSGTSWHPTSACRMGPNSTVAVVDSKLRVFGTTNLRIIDSSVMPFAPNGNTNLPSLVIGEIGASIILSELQQ